MFNIEQMAFLSLVLLGALPQGLFFSSKIYLLYFTNREPMFLCLGYIQTQLLGSKVAFCVHETLVWHTPHNPHDPHDPPDPLEVV